MVGKVGKVGKVGVVGMFGWMDGWMDWTGLGFVDDGWMEGGRLWVRMVVLGDGWRGGKDGYLSSPLLYISLSDFLLPVRKTNYFVSTKRTLLYTR